MKSISDALTQKWSFDQVIDHLKQQAQVEGLLLIGSGGKGTLTPASDYDLVIILHDAPRTWYVGVTTIADRFTDLIFAAASALDSINAITSPVPLEHELAPLMRWLKNGEILFDRFGMVARCQQKLRTSEWILPVDDEAAYEAWFAINYNLAVAARLASAADPLYQATASIRTAVYGHSDLWFGYFTIRKLAWEGDKAAVRYLQEHDHLFLATYQQFITTTALDQKLMLYHQAARLATAPFGGVWPDNISVMNNNHALQTWQDLFRTGD